MELFLTVWALGLTVLVGVGVIWILDLNARVGRVKARHESLYAGAEQEGDLSIALENLANRLSETNARTERLTARAERADATLAHSVQGVGLVRFSAFKDTGGDQSFALALADGEGNGVIISELFRRGETRIYAKPVRGWLSPNILGDEEREALAQAKSTVVGRD
jgi:hypothetical protein